MVRFSVLSIAILFVFRLHAGPLETLKPGEWREIPNSHLVDVAPSGWTANVMSPWSGGAFDSKRDRLIVWGGGHVDYAGNELYVFDCDTLVWQRLTNPSTDVGGDEASGVYPDGLPRSRHTYNYIEYLPNVDKFISLGGAGQYLSGQLSTQTVSAFDFTNLTWNSNLAKGGSGIGSACAYDSKTGLVWHKGGGTKLSSYDALADTWTSYTCNISTNVDISIALDPVRHILVTFDGYGSAVSPVYLYDLDHPGTGAAITTAGDRAPETIGQEGAEGFAFDSVSGKFVSWIGGENIYTLTPPAGASTFAALAAGTWTWSKITPALSNAVTLSPRCTNGTYGRFRYVKSKNLFVVVNDITTNVYFYKLSPDVADNAPSARVTGLSGSATGTRQIDLTWQSVSDSMSGVAFYSVYRNGTLVGKSGTTAFLDTGLLENTSYSYEVSATKFLVNLEGQKSPAAVIATPVDNVRPLLLDAFSVNNPNQVTVFFNELMDKTTSETAANYSINNGVTIQSALLAADQKTVLLSISTQDTALTYTLTINNVADKSNAKNPILPNTSVQYKPAKCLVSLVAYFGSYAAPNIIPNGFVDGVIGVNDRSWTYTNIPASISGIDFMQSAQDDKVSARNEDSVMYRVRVAAPCTVFVALASSTVWLVKDGWVNSGLMVSANNVSVPLYKHYFPAGLIDLKRKQDASTFGTSYEFQVARTEAGTSIEAKASMAGQLQLAAYPNPFTPSSQIRILLPVSSNVKLAVYDVSGKRVRTLVNGKMDAGMHLLRWDATAANGMMQPAGVYIYKLTAGARVLKCKTVFVR